MLLNHGLGEDLRVPCKEIKPVNPKGNQSWILIGRIDVEAETPILWPPDANNWLIGKDPDAGKDWRREDEGKDRGKTSWMTSLTRWTRVWASSGGWWWTGKHGVLQSMGSQRVWHDWATELISNLLSIANKYLENKTNLSLSCFFVCLFSKNRKKLRRVKENYYNVFWCFSQSWNGSRLHGQLYRFYWLTSFLIYWCNFCPHYN